MSSAAYGLGAALFACGVAGERTAIGLMEGARDGLSGLVNDVSAAVACAPDVSA